DCATTPRSARCFDEVVVPDHAYLVLGDHRAVSSDSAANCRAHPTEAPGAACWRWVYSDEIVGRAVAILWPIGRWNAL
ncbi:MAG: signal peptidase I, partial [Microbacterium sp.]